MGSITRVVIIRDRPHILFRGLYALPCSLIAFVFVVHVSLCAQGNNVQQVSVQGCADNTAHGGRN